MKRRNVINKGKKLKTILDEKRQMNGRRSMNETQNNLQLVLLFGFISINQRWVWNGAPQPKPTKHTMRNLCSFRWVLFSLFIFLCLFLSFSNNAQWTAQRYCILDGTLKYGHCINNINRRETLKLTILNAALSAESIFPFNWAYF